MMINMTNNHLDKVESGKDRSFGAITLRINSFKKFATKHNNSYGYVYSDTVWIRGLPWQVRVDCDCRKGLENSFVDAFLFCKATDVPKSFDCFVRATFMIISASLDKSKDVSYRLREHFVAKQMAWGCTNLKRVSDLIKQESDYLLHGALYMNVSIVAEKPFGIESMSREDNDEIHVLDDKFASQLTEVNAKLDQLSKKIDNERNERNRTEVKCEWLTSEMSRLSGESESADSKLSIANDAIEKSKKYEDYLTERLAELETQFESLRTAVSKCQEMMNDADSGDESELVSYYGDEDDQESLITMPNESDCNGFSMQDTQPVDNSDCEEYTCSKQSYQQDEENEEDQEDQDSFYSDLEKCSSSSESSSSTEEYYKVDEYDLD